MSKQRAIWIRQSCKHKLPSSWPVVCFAICVAAPSIAGPKETPEELIAGSENSLTRLNVELQNIKRQYLEVPDPGILRKTEDALADARTRYLQGDYAGASVILSDLLGDERFAKGTELDATQYELADSHIHSGNPLSARAHLEMVLKRRNPKLFVGALISYLSVARPGLPAVDAYMAQVPTMQAGPVPSDLLYAYAKYLWRSPAQRARSQALFTALAADPRAPHQKQALFFLGAEATARSDWTHAREHFERLLQLSKTDTCGDKLRELAELAIARLDVELKEPTKAIAAYSRIPRTSEDFRTALYESAWAATQAGDVAGAQETLGLLELANDGNTDDPDVKLLIAALQRRRGSFKGVKEELYGLSRLFENREELVTEFLAKGKGLVDEYWSLIIPEHGTPWLPRELAKWLPDDESSAAPLTREYFEAKQSLIESEDLAAYLHEYLREGQGISSAYIAEGSERLRRAEDDLRRTEEHLIEAARGYVAKGSLLEQRFQRWAQERDDARSKPTKTNRAGALAERTSKLSKQLFEQEFALRELSAGEVSLRELIRGARNRERDLTLASIARELEVLRHDNGVLRIGVERARQRASRSLDAALDTDTTHEQSLAAVAPLFAAAIEQASATEGNRLQTAWTNARTVRTEAAQVRATIIERSRQKTKELKVQVERARANTTEEAKQLRGILDAAEPIVEKSTRKIFTSLRGNLHDYFIRAELGLADLAFERKQAMSARIRSVAESKERDLAKLDEDFRDLKGALR